MDLGGITSDNVLKRVNALLKLDEQATDLNEEMAKEIREIEKRYAVKFAPIFTKRGEIIAGSYEPTEEDSKAKEPIVIADSLGNSDEKGIPGFWVRVLSNTQDFGEIIDEVDRPALDYLTDISVDESSEDKLVFTFKFAENPYFTNTAIVKTIIVTDGDFETVDNTPIDWKEGKNFTVKTVSKSTKARGRGKKPTAQVKTVQEDIPCFFNSFLVPKDEESEEADELLMIQCQLCIRLKDQIIPNAIDYFLDRAQEEDEMPYGDYGMDFEDEEGMEEDEDDEDDDQPPRRGKPAPKDSKPAVPTDPQCKQQ
eukprot:gene530-668_t